jgi:hypothetical protein
MAMKIKTHFQFSLDVWDATDENVVERVAGINDVELAKAGYQAALKRWPQSEVILRQSGLTVQNSGPRPVIA